MTPGGADALEELLRVARHIERLHRLGRQRFEDDELLRLALQRLWIALGEAARRYCQAEDVGPGMPPWADMIGFRDKLAHLYLSEVSNQLLWEPEARDLPEWQRTVEDLLTTTR